MEHSAPSDTEPSLLRRVHSSFDLSWVSNVVDLRATHWDELWLGVACVGALLFGCLLLVCCASKRRPRDTRGRALLLGEDDCEVHRSRVLETQFYLRSSDLYQLQTLLPQIGTRRDRCFCKVRLTPTTTPGLARRICRWFCLGRGGNQLMSVTSCADVPALHDERVRTSLHEMLVSRSRHAHLVPIHWAEVLPSARLVVVVRDWVSGGSLRDHMHGTPPSAPYTSKYNRLGKPFAAARIEKYGWQLLQAWHRAHIRTRACHRNLIRFDKDGRATLIALRPMGEWTALGTHCGNLFLGANGQLQLAEWEAALFGLPSTLEQSIEILRAYIEPAGVALCLVLYEMICGFENDAPVPSEYPSHCPERLLTLFRSLFQPERAPSTPVTLEEIASMPFFSCSSHAVQLYNVEQLPPLDRFCMELLSQQQRARAERKLLQQQRPRPTRRETRVGNVKHVKCSAFELSANVERRSGIVSHV